MDRLTFDGNFCDIAMCRENPCPYDGACTQRQVWERLKKYEETGLEPEEVAEMVSHETVEIARLLEKVCKEGSAQHMLELFQAEKDGRLVVLPCKVGDTVYTNFAMSGWYLRDKDRPYSATVVYVGLNGSDDMGGGLFNVVCGKHDYMMQFRFADIGRIVFLTNEEAEAELSSTNVWNTEGGKDHA